MTGTFDASMDRLEVTVPTPFLDPDHGSLDSDDRIGSSEDLQRAPDGVPHGTIGLTLAFAVMFAILLAVVFVSSGLAGRTTIVLVAMVGLPILVLKLNAHASRARDHVHPSR
jgi:hypothetical protein